MSTGAQGLRYISNLNSFSALIDRIIVENLKLQHFQHAGNTSAADGQVALLSALQQELTNLFEATLAARGYQFIGEQRTFVLGKLAQMLDDIEQLTVCHDNIKRCDSGKLVELQKDEPDIERILDAERLNRVSLEDRSRLKNRLDNSYADLVHAVE